jgi:hypothetical protein
MTRKGGYNASYCATAAGFLDICRRLVAWQEAVEQEAAEQEAAEQEAAGLIHVMWMGGVHDQRETEESIRLRLSLNITYSIEEKSSGPYERGTLWIYRERALASSTGLVRLEGTLWIRLVEDPALRSRISLSDEGSSFAPKPVLINQGT